MERFEVCLGAFLTQNTSWMNVMNVLSLLKKKRKLSFRSLEAMPERELRVFFRSSGYFRQKAKRVRMFLQTVRQETNGDIRSFLRGPLDGARNKLLSLHGVGPETADSMLLYAGGRPVFVVDAYTRRIGRRWGRLNGAESYQEIQTMFMGALPSSAALFGEYHALVVSLAKRYCQKKPLCASCPLRRVCKTGRAHS